MRRSRGRPGPCSRDRQSHQAYIFTRYEEFKDPVVRAYMKYFATKNADSSETKTINSQVSFYKTDTFIRNKYMTYEYDLHESKEAGRAEGLVEGEAKGEVKGHNDALDVAKDMNLSPELIAEFKARLEAKSVQK